MVLILACANNFACLGFDPRSYGAIVKRLLSRYCDHCPEDSRGRHQNGGVKPWFPAILSKFDIKSKDPHRTPRRHRPSKVWSDNVRSLRKASRAEKARSTKRHDGRRARLGVIACAMKSAVCTFIMEPASLETATLGDKS